MRRGIKSPFVGSKNARSRTFVARSRAFDVGLLSILLSQYALVSKILACWGFHVFCCRLLTFFQNKVFQKNLSGTVQDQSVKQFGSRSGPIFFRSWSVPKLFSKVISRREKSPLANLGGLSQQAHYVKTTSYQRRCDVMTSHRR